MCEPTIFNKTRHSAAKSYKCYECQTEIAKGDKYDRHSGLWDDSWDTYKICLKCADEIEAAFKKEPDFYFEYGQLHDFIAETANGA